MQLNELLAHVAGEHLDDRTAMVSGAPDSLWSDEALVRYLNQAQEILCRKAWVIVDSDTAACCQVTPVADQNVYSLHASVLSVLSVRPGDASIDLPKMSYETLRPRPIHADYWDINIASTDASGRPLAWAPDYASRKLYLRPAPNAEAATDIGTLYLRVARLPGTRLTVADPDAEPEVPPEYHMDLCTYAAGMAMLHGTVDDQDSRAEGRRLVKDFMGAVRRARGDRHVAELAQPRWAFGGWAST